MAAPVINVADLEVGPPDPARMPTGPNAGNYDIRRADIARRIGARKLGYNLSVVAPGKRNCPFHSHHAEEEMFFILEGSGELRYGDTRHPLRAGDVIACPPGGPETAHQIINTGTEELRYLAVSTEHSLEMAQYPDSGKFAVKAEFGTAPDGTPRRFIFVGRETQPVDYWDGE